MPRYVLILILALTAVGVASCSTATAPAPGPPPFVAHSATLAVTNGIKVMTTVQLPAGFAPIATRPPLWLQEGAEIGLIGTQDGHTIMYGLGGASWRTGRILAAETGTAAAEEGKIADIAASPNGLTLATAMVVPGAGRVDMIIRDLIATGPGNVLASFNGDYDSISISWLNNATVAVALRRHPEPLEPGDSGLPPKSNADQADAEPPPNSADGLQLLVITGAGSVLPLKLPCPMSSLSWSAHGVYAVGQGDASTPPVIVDRRDSTCTRFHVSRPIRVLDWDTDDEGSFLYVGPDPSGNTIGVFRYNIATGAEHLMGVSTSASSFAAGSDTVTLGQSGSFIRSRDRASAGVAARANRNRAIRPEQGRCEVARLQHVAGNVRAEHDGLFEGRGRSGDANLRAEPARAVAKNRHLLTPLRQRISGGRRPSARHRHDELVAARPMAGVAGRRRNEQAQ